MRVHYNTFKARWAECLTYFSLRQTANNMTILFFHLANQDKQDKLYRELQEHVKDNEPLTAETLSRLSYLKTCLKESFRYSSYQREHQFNLKGGGGYRFFRSQNMFFFASQRRLVFKAQIANRIFFSDHFRDRIFFQSNLQTEFFPQKNHSPPPPPTPSG